MRCPDCNKFVAQEVQDPEIELEEDIDTGAEPPTATFNATARIVVVCADCGTELKEASFDFDGEMDEDEVAAHVGEGHELSLELDDEEATERSEGKGRSWTKHFYGVKFTVGLNCKCKEKGPVYSEYYSDEIPASAMDELV